MNKHTPDIEGIIEAFDAFLDRFTGKHEKDNWLKQSLYADTVQVRKDLIVKEFQSILQSQADEYEKEKGEMVRTILSYKTTETNGDPYVRTDWITGVTKTYGVDLSE